MFWTNYDLENRCKNLETLYLLTNVIAEQRENMLRNINSKLTKLKDDIIIKDEMKTEDNELLELIFKTKQELLEISKDIEKDFRCEKNIKEKILILKNMVGEIK